MAAHCDARRQAGFTLVEVTIILLVLVILSTIMLPQLGNFNRLARRVTAVEDVGAICASVKKWLDEVMLSGPWVQPGGGLQNPQDPIGLLVGPGTTPVIGNGLAGATPRASNDIWDAPAVAIDAFTVSTDGVVPQTVAFDTDLLFHHLQMNNPQGISVDIEDRYKNIAELPEVGAWFGWRGPYFNELNPDPWGGRYSVNTFGLHSAQGGEIDDIYSTAVVCISFGPDHTTQTLANQPIVIDPYGFVIGGDDIAAVLSGVGPF
ncbi:MAG: hypothetical protein GKS06_05025 [Acidobacteria bacterium]|nr:hypothetical protein [Acidobacteriota bacterium]